MLKTMLRNHASKFGAQWDNYLPGVLWAYQNTPHESTGEKPSFLLFGMDCRSPTEAALLPPTPIQVTDVSNYREELVLSLSAARHSAAKCIQQAQKRYKKYYDRKAAPRPYQVGDWVLVKFPHEETGKQHKLSPPWHGPYHVLARNDPDLTVAKVYFPQDGQIQIHQLRVTPCPAEFPAGYYWYGKKKQSPGRPAKWVEQLLSSPSRLGQNCGEQQPNESEAATSESEYDEKSDDEEEEADCEESDH